MSEPGAKDQRIKRSFYRHLYVQVLAAIILGILVGCLKPDLGLALKPLGDGFIKLIKMIIAPVIFVTIAMGIANVRDPKMIGGIAGKAAVYFLIFSTIALLLGLAVGNLVQPGAGMNIDPASLDRSAISAYAQSAEQQTFSSYLLGAIPKTFFSGVTDGEILQILLVAVLTGFALAATRPRSNPAIEILASLNDAIFWLVHLVMKLSPVGAFGAMAFTISAYGIGTIAGLASLIATFYLTALTFIIVVLGVVSRLSGFSIFKLIRYLWAELILILATSSSEVALPNLMEKLKIAGCEESVVGLVVPTGYSFNLDGTNIYMTMAVIFISQALNIELTWTQQLTILAVAMLTSKGASGITGAGFITLAATLAVVPDIPVAGMVLILGIDRFMSECRALTNITGNGVACVVISAWERELDRAKLARVLSGDRSDEGVPATPAV